MSKMPKINSQIYLKPTLPGEVHNCPQETKMTLTTIGHRTAFNNG